MTAIVRVPKVEPEPLTTVGRKRAPRSKSAKPPSRPSRAKSVKEEPEVDEDEGIDDMTDPDGLVWSWEGNAETTRRKLISRHQSIERFTHLGFAKSSRNLLHEENDGP